MALGAVSSFDILSSFSFLSWASLSSGLALVLYSGGSSGKWVRPLLCVLSIVLAWRYMIWRFTETLPEPSVTATFIISIVFFGFELLSTISVTGLMVMLCRTRDRSGEADKNARWWGNRTAPRVALFITTYNEGLDVLERTIAGARATHYPNFDVFVLDDGKRVWLAAYCARNNVRYIARPDNAHAKSGNINYAFHLLRAGTAPPDFVAILDADFIPHSDFISRGISLFHDPSVALVQTPQYLPLPARTKSKE